MKLPLLVVSSLLLLSHCTGSDGGHVLAVSNHPSDAGTPPDAAVKAPVQDAATCVVEGQCASDDGCCSGFCSIQVYTGVGSCQPPQPAGSYCESDRWCADGACVDSTCAAPAECLATGERCTGAVGCCDGYCDGVYFTGHCQPLLQAGEECTSTMECASGNCDEGLCRVAECAPAEQQCWGHGDCCTGFCTWNGITYSPGQCAPRQPAASACDDFHGCQSGVCVDGVCS